MSFRRRTYEEVLDELLTVLVGGVAGETHPYPPDGAEQGAHVHFLTQPPAGQVVAVHGARGGQPHRFRKVADWILDDGGTAITWTEGGDRPDPGTLVSVTYLPEAANPALTDLQVGSVTRTLAEAAARELARLEAQLQAVHEAGFIDTATGRSLDNVVALLGVERVRASRPAGDVEFSRSPGNLGTITIPAGTRIMTEDGSVEYATTATVTMVAGQQRIQVATRDLEPANDGLAADQLTVLPAPIAGISGVTNPAPTVASGRDEDDDELRTRAKSFLHGSERATLGALTHAVRRQGITADVVEDPTPGHVTITPHADVLAPEQQQRLLQAVHEARPAGVVVTVKGPQAPRLVDLELVLTTTSGLLPEDLQAAQRGVRDAIAKEFERVAIDADVSLNRLVSQALAIPGVEDLRIVSATTSSNGTSTSVLDRDAGVLDVGDAPTRLGTVRVADPNLPTRLGVIVTWPAGDSPPDPVGIRHHVDDAVAALNAINQAPPEPDEPAGLRVLDYVRLRSVIPLPGRDGATLADVDAGVATADDGAGSPYRVRFLLSGATGLTRVIAEPGDEVGLTPFERLTLDTVDVVEEVGASA